MLRFIAAFLLFAFSASAAVLPEKFGAYTRGASSAATLIDRAIWDEYGLKASEQASYSGRRNFTVTAFRFADPTGAAAAFDWQRPANAMASNVANLAALYPGGELVVFGNYLLRVDGWQPAAADLADLAKVLPNVSRASLPIVRAYLPERGLIAGSDRYILGPASLSQFAPQFPATVLAFDQFSTEGEVAKYRTAGGDVTLGLFMFPTPQIARERFTGFEAIPGAAAKRSGTIVAVVTSSTSAAALNRPQSEAAQRLLNRIEYRPEFTVAESVRTRPRENVGQMILAIFTLAGILISVALVLGLLFGGLRVFGKKFGIGPAEDSFTALHISGK
jgi:hypothetical protein